MATDLLSDEDDKFQKELAIALSISAAAASPFASAAASSMPSSKRSYLRYDEGGTLRPDPGLATSMSLAPPQWKKSRRRHSFDDDDDDDGISPSQENREEAGEAIDAAVRENVMTKSQRKRLRRILAGDAEKPNKALRS